MIYDFTLAETLRLANVKRWGIVEMSRDQSVAEHTCNVMMIAQSLVTEYNKMIAPEDMISTAQQLTLLRACLTHDLPEIYSGDIPTPTKRAVGRSAFQGWERKRFPLLYQLMRGLDPVTAKIKALADVMEARIYLRRWCVDLRFSMILEDLDSAVEALLQITPDSDVRQRTAICRAVERVDSEVKMHGGMS